MLWLPTLVPEGPSKFARQIASAIQHTAQMIYHIPEMKRKPNLLIVLIKMTHKEGEDENVDALLRLAIVHNIPVALDPLTAENHLDSVLKVMKKSGRKKNERKSRAGAGTGREQGKRETA